MAAASAAGAAPSPQPVPQPSVAIDGPSAAIGALSGVSLFRDGTGGVIYLKSVGGVPHVFVSRVLSGAFGAPERVDTGLAGASSQPVIAAGGNGKLLIAFINGGQLYAVSRTSLSSPYSLPGALASAAENPDLALSVNGKGYLAFTEAGSGGHDVRAAYYVNGLWAVESAPLDASPTDDAGIGTGRPEAAAAGDGEAIIVWGEAGHVYSRRVWATSPSVVFEQADVATFAGAPGGAAGSPVISTADDSSFADVAFTEVVGGVGRVLERRLRGSQFEGPTAVDGAGASATGAYGPQIAEAESTHALLTSARSGSNQVYTAVFGASGLFQGTQQVDLQPSVSAPAPVPATTGFVSGMIAWQRDPQPFPTEIDERFYDGTSFGPELALSSSANGPTNAAAGLGAGGDIAGDEVVAWVQGAGPNTRISGALLYYPPGGFGPRNVVKYSRGTRPVFTWSASREEWGPISYGLSIDGVPVARTGGTSVRVPGPLAQGPHIWQVSAVNQAGVATAASAVSLFVDSVAPTVQFTLTGRERRGTGLRLTVRASDVPAIGGTGSGVSSVVVRWGDGTSTRIHNGARHAYTRVGSFQLRLTATDRAGNATKLARLVRIVPASG